MKSHPITAKKDGTRAHTWYCIKPSDDTARIKYELEHHPFLQWFTIYIILWIWYHIIWFILLCPTWGKVFFLILGTRNWGSFISSKDRDAPSRLQFWSIGSPSHRHSDLIPRNRQAFFNAHIYTDEMVERLHDITCQYFAILILARKDVYFLCFLNQFVISTPS